YFAFGPSRIDPRTGEILDAGVVVIADAFLVYGQRLRRLQPGACAAGQVAADLIGLAQLLSASGLLAADLGAQLGGLVKWLVMHEIGHTLGLRHNFRGSASIPFAK